VVFYAGDISKLANGADAPNQSHNYKLSNQLYLVHYNISSCLLEITGRDHLTLSSMVDKEGKVVKYLTTMATPEHL